MKKSTKTILILTAIGAGAYYVMTRKVGFYLSGLGAKKTRAQRQAERTAARAAKRTSQPTTVYQDNTPSFAQAAPVSADARWAQVGGVVLVRTPYVTVPTPESLVVDGIAQYPNGYYKDIQWVKLKPGVSPLDYINAKTWAERNYRPVSGSEAMMVKSIQALS